MRLAALVAAFFAALAAPTLAAAFIFEGKDQALRQDCASTSDRTVLVAAYNGCLDMLTERLSAGDSLNVRSPDGWTPLFLAVAWRHDAVAQALIDAGADVDDSGDLDVTPLMIGTANASLDTVALLIARGADADVQTQDGDTALMFSVWKAEPDRVALLLNAGADLDAATAPDAMTALHYAAERRLPEIARMLIDAGASVDPPNACGVTPLMTALVRDGVETARLLIDAGADVTRDAPDGVRLADWARSDAARAVLAEAGAAPSGPPPSPEDAEAARVERLRLTIGCLYEPRPGTYLNLADF